MVLGPLTIAKILGELKGVNNPVTFGLTSAKPSPLTA